MRGKKFYITLIGLLIIGIGSIFIYRKNQDARALEFEGYEIAAIEDRVAALYNDDKTDIQEDISSELKELEQIFNELNEKDLSQLSKRQIADMEVEFLTAQEMYDLQKNISNLYKEDEVVKKTISVDDIEELRSTLETFEDRTTYYNRNDKLLSDARVQLETIEEATQLVENLTIDGIPNEELTQDELDAIEELVNEIKDETIKGRLLEEIESVRLALNEVEDESLELDEDELAEENEEETIEDETVETAQETDEETEESASTSQNSNRTRTDQAQTSNRDRQNTSQPSRQPNEQPNRQPSRPSNNHSNNQENNQSNTSPQRPTIVEQYKESQIVEYIPYETSVYENNNIPAGEEIVYVEGSQGTVTETYEVTVYSDGNVSRSRISRDVKEPVNRVVTVGTRGQ